jgi:hypothetical protein
MDMMQDLLENTIRIGQENVMKLDRMNITLLGQMLAEMEAIPRKSAVMQ